MTVIEATTPSGHDADAAPSLHRLIDRLKACGYRFVTPTPASHARVLARDDRRAAGLRDVFGWNMRFEPKLLDRDLLDDLADAGLIDEGPEGLKSRVRVSSLGDDLLVHSGFPTEDRDAVFFGPDSYRFARLIADELSRCPNRDDARLVDIGTGAGAGAIAAARCCPALDIAMTDINPAALRLAAVNAAAAGIDAALNLTGDLAAVAGRFDVVLANPPYIIDAAGRAYRDGGGMHGAEVALGMARQAVPRLAPGGRFILYTGSAIVGGEDALRERLAALATAERCAIRYEEIDPDVFGEELENPAYADVDRIALVAAVIERR